MGKTYDQRWAWDMMYWSNRAGESVVHLSLFGGDGNTVCGMSRDEFGTGSGAYNPEDVPDSMTTHTECTDGMEAALEKRWQEDISDRD